MEDDAILNMIEDEFCHSCFIIDFIVSNDNSTTKDVLKHTSRGDKFKL